MQRKNIVDRLLAARLAHTKWLRRAKHLIENMPVTSGMIPIDSTECEFGKWFYSEGLKYKNLPQLEAILDKIERLHEEVHNIYLDIYKIYFVELKRSWLMSKLVDGYKEPSLEQQKTAYRHYIQLEDVSVLLMKEFDLFERTLKNIEIKELRRVL
jgi:hypothetical protein